MAKYRKKPVVIEAVAWYGKYTDPSEWPHWFRDAVDSGRIIVELNRTLSIHTLEGWMCAGVGDKIILGVASEIYACKPDIFEKTYEPAE